jgi:hypothetical protein
MPHGKGCSTRLAGGVAYAPKTPTLRAEPKIRQLVTEFIAGLKRTAARHGEGRRRNR